MCTLWSIRLMHNDIRLVSSVLEDVRSTQRQRSLTIQYSFLLSTDYDSARMSMHATSGR